MNCIDRHEALSSFPALAQQILGWQAETLVLDSTGYQEGDEVYLELDDEAPAVLTAEMAEAFNLEEEAGLNRLRDPEADQFVPHKPEVFLIAEPPGDTLNECFVSAAECLQALSTKLEITEMAIMPMTRTPILCQKNDYPQAAMAASRLVSLGLSEDFEGAICGTVPALKSYVEPLFWIARCNASAPYISFGFRSNSITGTFCKYANIHFAAYEKADGESLQRDLESSGFKIAGNGSCYERFCEDGAIPGRRIQL